VEMTKWDLALGTDHDRHIQSASKSGMRAGTCTTIAEQSKKH